MRDTSTTSRYSKAVADAFLRVDLEAIAELQSDGKIEDRLRDDILLAMRRAGWPIAKGGPHRFDLFIPGAWAFELKMGYAGDHINDLRGTRADLVKLHRDAVDMAKTLGVVVSWHEGVIYPGARRCVHGTDRDACIRHWADLMASLGGGDPIVTKRGEFVLFLVEV